MLICPGQGSWLNRVSIPVYPGGTWRTGLWPLVPQELASLTQGVPGVWGHGAWGLAPGGLARRGDAGEEIKPICLQDSLLSLIS